MTMRAPIDLPPAIARAFLADLRAYHATSDPWERDAIAVRQLNRLRAYEREPLRLSDIKELFALMRGASAPKTSRKKSSPML